MRGPKTKPVELEKALRILAKFDYDIFEATAQRSAENSLSTNQLRQLSIHKGVYDKEMASKRMRMVKASASPFAPQLTPSYPSYPLYSHSSPSEPLCRPSLVMASSMTTRRKARRRRAAAATTTTMTPTILAQNLTRTLTRTEQWSVHSAAARR